LNKQSKQLLIDFINQAKKQHGYSLRILSTLDLTDDAFELAFKQLKELQVEQLESEEINSKSATTSARAQNNKAETSDDTKENPAENVIQFQEVKCRISNKDILKGITLNVKHGEIMGILGKNGAGKTTLLSLISGLRPPTSGEIAVLGKKMPARTAELRRKMGFVLQENALYEELTLFENLQFSARLYNVQDSQKRILEVLKILDLSDRVDQVVSTLSGGLKRRTAIARAFLHDPELFIIDEPTLGVDADARHAVWAYLRLLRSKNRTVVVATNYLDEALALCDRVAVLGEGNLLTVAEPGELVKNTGSCIDIECNEQTATKIFCGVRNSKQIVRADITLSGISLFLAKGSNPESVRRELAEYGSINAFSFRAPDLSEVFKSLGRSQ
jgi:ABC-2 type transport system ATP-binding protein